MCGERRAQDALLRLHRKLAEARKTHMLHALSAALSLGWTPVPPPPGTAVDRRAVLAGGLLGAASTVLSPLGAAAKIEAVNPVTGPP